MMKVKIIYLYTKILKLDIAVLIVQLIKKLNGMRLLLNKIVLLYLLILV